MKVIISRIWFLPTGKRSFLQLPLQLWGFLPVWKKKWRLVAACEVVHCIKTLDRWVSFCNFRINSPVASALLQGSFCWLLAALSHWGLWLSDFSCSTWYAASNKSCTNYYFWSLLEFPFQLDWMSCIMPSVSMCTPGKQTVTCHTWRPLQTGTGSALRRHFIGDSAELDELSYIRVPGTFKVGSKLPDCARITASFWKLKHFKA